MPLESKHKTADEKQRTRQELLKTEGKDEDNSAQIKQTVREGSKRRKTKAMSTHGKNDLRAVA